MFLDELFNKVCRSFSRYLSAFQKTLVTLNLVIRWTGFPRSLAGKMLKGDSHFEKSAVSIDACRLADRNGYGRVAFT